MPPAALLASSGLGLGAVGGGTPAAPAVLRLCCLNCSVLMLPGMLVLSDASSIPGRRPIVKRTQQRRTIGLARSRARARPVKIRGLTHEAPAGVCGAGAAACRVRERPRAHPTEEYAIAYRPDNGAAGCLGDIGANASAHPNACAGRPLSCRARHPGGPQFWGRGGQRPALSGR